MILDERKRTILQAIIDDYIDTAEPIGSRTIARKHELGLSSATIRNEMADLEEMGYLAQPHTSSGRVPSDKGYRLYVDQLMKLKELSADEINIIRTALESHINELGQLIKHASAVLSRFTRYTSVATTPHMKTSTVRAIQVIPIESGKALIVVVTNTGIVRNALVNLAEDIGKDMLGMISNALNKKLGNLAIEQIDPECIYDIGKELGISDDSLQSIFEGAVDCINRVDNLEVYLEGTTNIFNYPEFKDMVKAREFMNILDEKSSLCKIFSESEDNIGITVKIGSENAICTMREYSLIKAGYSLGGTFVGSIGVIGPTRMEYPRVISSMCFIREKINEEICRLMGINTGEEE